MRKKKATISILSFILGLFFFSACDKQNNEPEKVNTQVKFSFVENKLKTTNENNLTSVVISVEDMEGNVIKNSESLSLYDMNGHYISEPIELLTGDYKLTQFLILNDANEVVLASPTADSPKAYLVDQPLPINFTALKDEVVNVVPEVLSTANSTPEDFGYSTFGFQGVSTFDFLVGAFIYNGTAQNFEITTADITIRSGDIDVYSGQLQANNDAIGQGITNQITLPEKYDNFSIEITKAGYITYTATFTKDELKQYFRSQDNGPLIVILEENSEIPGLVAHYPFNGDYLDNSGNGLDAINSGSVFDLDRNSNANSSAKFDGIDDYLTLPSDFDIPEKTISLWFYTNAFPEFDYVNNPHGSWNSILACNHPALENPMINLNVSKINGVNKLWFTQVWETPLDPDLISSPIEASTWYNVILTISTETVNLYIDGVLIGSHAIGYNHAQYDGNPNLMVGTARHPNGRYHDGGIDDLRIYNRVLSANEIQQLSSL